MCNTRATYGDDCFLTSTPLPFFHAQGNASSCPLLRILKLDKEKSKQVLVSVQADSAPTQTSVSALCGYF